MKRPGKYKKVSLIQSIAASVHLTKFDYTRYSDRNNNCCLYEVKMVVRTNMWARRREKGLLLKCRLGGLVRHTWHVTELVPIIYDLMNVTDHVLR